MNTSEITTLTSPYHEVILDPPKFRALFKQALGNIRKIRKTLNFDHMVVSGVSGLSMGFPLSLVTKIPLVVVRKTTKDCHSPYMVEGLGNLESYVILDDFIASGQTIERIMKTLCLYERKRHSHNPSKIKCVGVLLYNISAFETVSHVSSGTILNIPRYNISKCQSQWDD